MLLDPTSAFIATVGEDHMLVLPDSIPAGSQVAIVLITSASTVTQATSPTPASNLGEAQDAWDLLLELARTASSGGMSDAAENHDQYLYGNRL